jgi:hypothetical protein
MSSHTKLTDGKMMTKLEYYLNKLNDNTTQDEPELWYAPAGVLRGKLSDELFFKAEYECKFDTEIWY